MGSNFYQAGTFGISKDLGTFGALALDATRSSAQIDWNDMQSLQGGGIQMLSADGLAPIALGVEVPVIAILPGNTVLDFKARMYQPHPADEGESGSVERALNFTLTYK